MNEEQLQQLIDQGLLDPDTLELMPQAYNHPELVQQLQGSNPTVEAPAKIQSQPLPKESPKSMVSPSADRLYKLFERAAIEEKNITKPRVISPKHVNRNNKIQQKQDKIYKDLLVVDKKNGTNYAEEFKKSSYTKNGVWDGIEGAATKHSEQLTKDPTEQATHKKTNADSGYTSDRMINPRDWQEDYYVTTGQHTDVLPEYIKAPPVNGTRMSKEEADAFRATKHQRYLDQVKAQQAERAKRPHTFFQDNVLGSNSIPGYNMGGQVRGYEDGGDPDNPLQQAGIDIKDFQQYINMLYNAGLTADGQYGPQTAKYLGNVNDYMKYRHPAKIDTNLIDNFVSPKFEAGQYSTSPKTLTDPFKFAKNPANQRAEMSIASQYKAPTFEESMFDSMYRGDGVNDFMPASGIEEYAPKAPSYNSKVMLGDVNLMTPNGINRNREYGFNADNPKPFVSPITKTLPDYKYPDIGGSPKEQQPFNYENAYLNSGIANIALNGLVMAGQKKYKPFLGYEAPKMMTQNLDSLLKPAAEQYRASMLNTRNYSPNMSNAVANNLYASRVGQESNIRNQFDLNRQNFANNYNEQYNQYRGIVNNELMRTEDNNDRTNEARRQMLLNMGQSTQNTFRYLNDNNNQKAYNDVALKTLGQNYSPEIMKNFMAQLEQTLKGYGIK